MLDFNSLVEEKKKKIDLKLNEISLNCSHSSYWNISYDLGKVLYSKILEFGVRNVLEFGTSNGFSTLWIAKGMLDKDNFFIKTIEVDDSRFLEAKKNFEECGVLDNICQLKTEIFEFLENLDLGNEIEYDLIFLDAMQRRYLDVVKLIEEKKLLRKGGIIIADNVISHKNMDEFLDYMKENYSCEIVEIDSGFLIARSV